jgi:hypothetical protein
VKAGDGDGDDDNNDKEEEEEKDDDNDDDHKLQQVAEDYQPVGCLNEGTPIFILLSVQPKL